MPPPVVGPHSPGMPCMSVVLVAGDQRSEVRPIGTYCTSRTASTSGVGRLSLLSSPSLGRLGWLGYETWIQSPFQPTCERGEKKHREL
jgi:hypothetical protein